jgi:hypothetical protein
VYWLASLFTMKMDAGSIPGNVEFHSSLFMRCTDGSLMFLRCIEELLRCNCCSYFMFKSKCNFCSNFMFKSKYPSISTVIPLSSVAWRKSNVLALKQSSRLGEGCNSFKIREILLDVLHLKIDVKVVYFKGRKDFTTIKKNWRILTNFQNTQEN